MTRYIRQADKARLSLLAILFLASCAASVPWPRKIDDLPFCRGTWVCENRRDQCVCLDAKRFEEWKRRNGL